MLSNAEQEICSFIRAFIGRSESVTSDASIWGDLGVDGQDASELIDAFAKEFEVDMTDFHFSEYFGPERAFGIGTFISLVDFIRCRSWGKATRLKHLYVSDLVEAASRHRWVSAR